MPVMPFTQTERLVKEYINVVKADSVPSCVLRDVLICETTRLYYGEVERAIDLVKHRSTASSGYTHAFAFTTRLLSLTSQLSSNFVEERFPSLFSHVHTRSHLEPSFINSSVID